MEKTQPTKKPNSDIMGSALYDANDKTKTQPTKQLNFDIMGIVKHETAIIKIRLKKY